MIENLDTKVIINPQEISELQRKAIATGTRVVFVDASFYLPDSNKDALDLYNKKHIFDAVFFSINDIKNNTSSLPHMLPDIELYQQKISNIGLKNDDIIVTYGQNGMIMGPCRAWWMIKGFGHRYVMVLDGGLPHWEQSGLPVTSQKTQIKNSIYNPKPFNSESIIDMKAVIQASNEKTCPIIDARPASRFSGESPEPRAGMRSGHIPNSINVPCSALVDDNDGCFKSKTAIKELFQAKGIAINPNQKYITTCGSGVTACALSLALNLLGVKSVAVYDGSWSEWGLKTSPTVCCTSL